MPELTVNGTTLHHERRGAGEPLLLLQGLGGNSMHWGEPFLTELERDFELLIYDHRGTGRSGPTGGAFTIADLAEDAVALLDALEVERAHVLGISMGGMVAQELALGHRDRLRTLTLGCTYCGGPEALMTEQAVIGLLADAVLSGDPERAHRAGWEVTVSARHADDEASYARFVEVAAESPTPLPTLLGQVQAIGGHDTSDRLRVVLVPTLVVHGTEDRMLAPANGELIAGLIPNARLELLEGVGHLFFWEQPEHSARLVREHALGAAGGAAQ